jgi:hypothetical protein
MQPKFLYIVFVIIFVVGRGVIANTNAYSCQGSSWSIENATITAAEFQDYLFATQNTCNRKVQIQPIGSTGIGATMKEAINLFLLSSEIGLIHRPHDSKPYLFADTKNTNCVANIRSIDCYFQPLSYCSTSLTAHRNNRSTLIYSLPKLILVLWVVC